MIAIRCCRAASSNSAKAAENSAVSDAIRGEERLELFAGKLRMTPGGRESAYVGHRLDAVGLE